jgi:hypothetical protein
MRPQHRRLRLGAASLVALIIVACGSSAGAVPFTTSYTDGENWGDEAPVGIYAQGFSPSQTPAPDPGLATDAIVPLDRFQFFKGGRVDAAANIRLAILTSYFVNIQNLTTTSPAINHGTAENPIWGLSTNVIPSTAAIPTGSPITFFFNHLPLVYGNDYAALYVSEGDGGVLTPVRVSSLIATYVETPPGSGMYRPESDYGDPDIDYFKSTSNTINTNEFGSFLVTFNAPYADANFVAAFDLPPADYNHDGNWNDADFTAWKNQFGQTAGLDADGDLDGDVDGADFLFWQRRYGGPASLASAGSVPEPAALTLAVFAALAARRRWCGA